MADDQVFSMNISSSDILSDKSIPYTGERYVFQDPETGLCIELKDKLFRTMVDKQLAGKGGELIDMDEVRNRKEVSDTVNTTKPVVIEPREDDIVI